jgi:CRP-like cAMP-binding protein
MIAFSPQQQSDQESGRSQEAGMARTAPIPRATENPDETYPLIDKLSRYLPLSPVEVSFLRDLHGARRHFDRRRDIIVQGRPYRSVFILCSGFVWRYKILPDGKRQLLSFGLPGDLIGFPAVFFENAVNATGSLSDVVVATVPFAALYDVFARFPRVAVALYWMAAGEAAVYGERIVDIGRRSAYERLAHLILELLTRLQTVGLAEELSYVLPLTQELIADVLGLSGPHVSRMLRSMREEGLVTIEDHRLTVTDLESLTQLAGFDDDYLARSRIPGLS